MREEGSAGSVYIAFDTCSSSSSASFAWEKNKRSFIGQKLDNIILPFPNENFTEQT